MNYQVVVWKWMIKQKERDGLYDWNYDEWVILSCVAALCGKHIVEKRIDNENERVRKRESAIDWWVVLRQK